MGRTEDPPGGVGKKIARRSAVTESDDDAIIIEFHRVGRSVKVTAIDPITLTEVSIVGPANAGDTLLSRNAVRKLKYVLAKTGLPSSTG